MEKGHCLNHLGDDTFDVSFPPPSSASQPKSVKRVHQIYEAPTFLESVSSAEVIQGSLGNCWAVAALSALADVDDGIRRLCVEYDTRELHKRRGPARGVTWWDKRLTLVANRRRRNLRLRLLSG